MHEQVEQILGRAFPGMEVSAESVLGGRVNGRVVWDGFTGHDNVGRQQMIRAALRDGLGAGVAQIGLLLAYTPHELQAMGED